MDVVDLAAARGNATQQRGGGKVRANAGPGRKRRPGAIVLLDDRSNVACLGDTGTCDRSR